MGERARSKSEPAPKARGADHATSGEHPLPDGGELARVQHELEHARAALRASARHRSDCMSRLVHDLQSPLTVMIGNADFMLSLPGQTPQNVECLRDVRQAADDMRAMVLDLLDISRSENGTLAAKQEQVDVAALLAGVHAAMTYSAEYRRQQIEAVMPVEPLLVRADRELLRRVLQNLIESALKYAPEGSAIRLSARADGAHVVFTVCDQGPPLPPEQRGVLFELPTQLERTHARSGRGGLGLHFCRVAALAMAGSIWAETAAPAGTALCVKLPRTT